MDMSKHYHTPLSRTNFISKQHSNKTEQRQSIQSYRFLCVILRLTFWCLFNLYPYKVSLMPNVAAAFSVTWQIRKIWVFFQNRQSIELVSNFWKKKKTSVNNVGIKFKIHFVCFLMYREKGFMVRKEELKHYGKAFSGKDHKWRRVLQSDRLQTCNTDHHQLL